MLTASKVLQVTYYSVHGIGLAAAVGQNLTANRSDEEKTRIEAAHLAWQEMWETRVARALR